MRWLLFMCAGVAALVWALIGASFLVDAAQARDDTSVEKQMHDNVSELLRQRGISGR
jgi:hypothetical protein